MKAERGRQHCNKPALILASISTLESAGIHDSGSSTRSWMGILWDGTVSVTGLGAVTEQL